MTLLLLTKYYPFGTGESFIENEIQIMANYYDRIIIIACEVPLNCNKTRTLPKNAIAYKINNTSKLKNCVIGFFKIPYRDNEFKLELNKCDTVLKKLFLAYFEEKSQKIYSSIKHQHILDTLTNDNYFLYSYWLFTTAKVGLLISKTVRPKKMISRAHRYDLYEDVNKLKYLPYRKLFLESYNVVFPCSNNGTDYLKNKYPQFTNSIKTSLLGTQDHGCNKESKDGVFRIVSCSRVEPVKRVDRIIDALRLLDQNGYNILWTHIGDGSGLASLYNKARNNLKNIKFKFYGNLKNEDVIKFYSSEPVDLLINVSSSEGLPVSIMEAISFGIPCIGTDVGGTSEIVVDGVTGKLISKDFKNGELANVIESYVNCKSVSEIRFSCRKYWTEHFQAFLNYQKLYEYLKILQSK